MIWNLTCASGADEAVRALRFVSVRSRLQVTVVVELALDANFGARCGVGTTATSHRVDRLNGGTLVPSWAWDARSACNHTEQIAVSAGQAVCGSSCANITELANRTNLALTLSLCSSVSNVVSIWAGARCR